MHWWMKTFRRQLRKLDLLGFLIATYTTGAAIQLVSTRDAALHPPAGGNGESGAPIISMDGRYVLLASTADNLVLISNRYPMTVSRPSALNVFLHDQITGNTTLASVNLAGTGGGNGDSLPAGISADGRYALFESSADDLVVGDTNNATDVFLRDMVNGTTLLVSIATNGTSGNGASQCSTMTSDGRYVAFVSAANDLVAGDTNGIPDVFVRDLQGGQTTLASTGAMSTGSFLPSSGSGSPELTPDGHFVVFFSTATNLVPGVKNVGEVYVRDLLAGTTIWASTNARSLFQATIGTVNIISCNPRISTNGQFVAFEACTNVAAGYYARGLVLRFNLQSGFTDIVHTNANVPSGVSFENMHNLDMTPDGRFVAFVGNVSGPATCIYLWDAQAGTNILASGNSNGVVTAGSLVYSPAVDRSGRYVAFLSNATDLTTNRLAAGYHLYIRDLQAGTTRLVDADTNTVGAGVNPITVPGLSGDGNAIVFESADGNLVPDDNNRENDVFVRDLTTDSTSLISAHHPDLPALSPNAWSAIYSSAVSTNGRYVAFASDANTVVANDTNGYQDVFVSDLWTGTNILVSADTNGFAAGSGISTEPAISGNGRYVVFSSLATNLVASDTNNAEDVFRRDLQAGTTELVSATPNGGYGNGDSYSPSISTDGRYVLFQSYALNLAPGVSGPSPNIFLRDMIVKTNYALTTAGGLSATMTPDGRYVAFIYSPSYDGSVWDTLAAKRIYTNTATGGFSYIAISPDGRWFVFSDTATFTLNAVDLFAQTNCVISSISSTWYLLPHPGLQFSADGRFLAYSVVTNGGLAARNVYLYDFQTGTNLLVSRSYNSANAPNDGSDSPVISADGRYVAYRSFASDCVSNDLNGAPDLFLFDRLSGTTTLLTPNQSDGKTANDRSLAPVFSGDGHTLLFQSWGSDLAAQQGSEGSDLFAMKLSMTDSDGDGMDDQWEMAYFGSLDRDGTGDYDLDGVSDLDEYLAGTDPTDSNSVFRARAIYSETTGQNVSITWPTAPGKTYQVQFKNDLNDSSWQNLDGNVVLQGNQAVLPDSVSAIGQKFYRVVIVH